MQFNPQSEEFEDKYGRAARRAIYHMAKAAPIKPRYHKGKKVTQDYWTCANCGRTVDVLDAFHDESDNEQFGEVQTGDFVTLYRTDLFYKEGEH